MPDSFPVQAYTDIRPTLQTGDVVTFIGDSLLSRAIRICAPGGSHTAMVFRVPGYGSVMLWEALEFGLQLRRMRHRISNYPGRVLVSRLDAPESVRTDMGRMMLAFLGSDTRYDWLSLFRNAWRRVRLNMSRGFCSESAQYVLMQHHQIPFNYEAMTPGELLAALPNTIQLAPYSAESEAQG